MKMIVGNWQLCWTRMRHHKKNRLYHQGKNKSQIFCQDVQLSNQVEIPRWKQNGKGILQSG
jgi:hypothetical protein